MGLAHHVHQHLKLLGICYLNSGVSDNSEGKEITDDKDYNY